MYTASFAFFEAIWDAGVTHCFVNLGSDHPSIMEAIVKGLKERQENFPRIITCPNEMVALSMADGFARVSGKPQCVIIHVDVGTSGLGAAVHNASAGKAPVLIFAGLSPCTLEGEYTGSRTEYIHWLQDIPDQKQIVSQYCRYIGEIKRGKNVKQLVNRALSMACSSPMGPVYLTGAREAMEEEIEPYAVDQAYWTTPKLGIPTIDNLRFIANALLSAQLPLILVGSTGRDHSSVGGLIHLANLVKGVKILDTAGSDMCFPANHPAWLGLRYGEHECIATADFIMILECDVPWITSRCRPRKDAVVIHIDSDPLKHGMPVFYLDAIARFQVNAVECIQALNRYIEESCSKALASSARIALWHKMVEAHKARLSHIAAEAQPSRDGVIQSAFLMCELRKMCPPDTVWAVEAVTNATIAADQIQATLPGSWINCGGGGLGWSGGGALGVKLAIDQHRRTSGFVCQIVGDGAYLFSVPSSVYWISQRYDLPILTIVLNNNGWNAPRKSLLAVHPNGDASRATNDELNIAFNPAPDYAGIAKAAACGKAWVDQAKSVEELREMLPEAVDAVRRGELAVLEVCISAPTHF